MKKNEVIRIYGEIEMQRHRFLNTISKYNWLVIIIFRFILEFIYKEFLSVVFRYAGFTYNFDLYRYIFSWVVFLISMPFFLNMVKNTTISNTIVLLFYILSFVPGLVMLAFMETPFAFLWCIYWFVLLTMNYSIKEININPIKKQISMRQMSFIIQIIFLIVVFVWSYYAKFHLQISIINVYSTRELANGMGIPIVIRYLISMIEIIIPCLCVWCLSQKKRFLFLELVLTQYLTFCVDASKSTVFSLLFSVVAYYMLKKSLVWFKLIPLAITGLNIVSYMAYWLYNEIMPLSLFYRRVMFVPAQLNYFYYDFFSKHPKDLFAQSILRRFGVVSNYNVLIPKIIGRIYENSECHDNNGLFSDAYANLGIVGIIVMPILIVLTLKLMQRCAKALDISVAVAAIITTSFVLISSSFFTCLLTHGILANCIIFYLIPRDIDKYDKTERNNFSNKNNRRC